MIGKRRAVPVADRPYPPGGCRSRPGELTIAIPRSGRLVPLRQPAKAGALCLTATEIGAVNRGFGGLDRLIQDPAMLSEPSADFSHAEPGRDEADPLAGQIEANHVVDLRHLDEFDRGPADDATAALR